MTEKYNLFGERQAPPSPGAGGPPPSQGDAMPADVMRRIEKLQLVVAGLKARNAKAKKSSPIVPPRQVEIVVVEDQQYAFTQLAVLLVDAGIAAWLLRYLRRSFPALPAVGYRHSLAGLVLLGVASWSVRPGHRLVRPKR